MTLTTAPWPGSAQDQEREALGNPSSSGLPLPSISGGQRQLQKRGVAQPGRRGVAEEGRGSARQKGCGGRGAWLNHAEGSQVLEADGHPRLIRIRSEATRMPALKLSLGGTEAAACPWEMKKMEEEVGKSSGQQGHPLPTQE